MDDFVSHSRPAPVPLATSSEIHDRNSIFSASIYTATSLSSVNAIVRHVRNTLHYGPKKASHEMSAWRFMTVRNDKTGLGGPDDFMLQDGSDDDGELWAGGKILKVMREEKVLDTVVIVSRWCGGVLLGPARFEHIEKCAREVCASVRRIEQVEELISQIETLDKVLTDARQDLKRISQLDTSIGTSSKSIQRTKELYVLIKTELDVDRAKKLVKARESAVNAVKLMISKKRSQSDNAAEGQFGSISEMFPDISVGT